MLQRADFDKIAEQVRNWGRWGPEDQRGTLNHIGPEALKRAAGEVTAGKLFNLGLRFDENGPQPPGTGRFNPQKYVTALGQPLGANPDGSVFSDDVINMPPQCATQWDALSHVHYDGVLYNGCKACDTLSVKGASRHGIEHLASPGILSRGVLLDIARLKGGDALPASYAITPDDLEAACAAQNVRIETGDIVLVRTGQMARFTQGRDAVAYLMGQPGLVPDCAHWIHETSIAAICADNVAVELLEADHFAQDMPLPLHMFCLRDMGLPLGEMFDLDALAADCASDGRYSFLLAAPPLAITGGFGSPVNPLALK